ncbi:ThiF family adenylyltransferase [Desulfitobacterium sp.]|uniref:ThiF family adenylyltransferase n=1 Tax=Desulfitobacterium sp. TaxID=49981 RepID=UPI002D0BF5C4|nr:ThiF family adenylyltransferase [Desulfitobacterium sp.]HVJ48787.1 ThiF family adenylyltransferase [Desulfitobacterium sp.]
MDIAERYSRQVLFSGIGKEGQKRLAEARVAVIGVGALGTVIANNLCRAGVGLLRLIDRDFVEISNLQRQTLFTEADVSEHIPKAVAAVEHLKKINSEITLEPVVKDVNPSNVEQLIGDVDLVLDGTDNFEIRLLINDACVKLGIPWIYGGAIGSYGITMNIIPGETPCLRCLLKEIPAPGTQPTCSTAGVLNMITGIIGNYETVEAVKFLVKSPDLRKDVLFVDIWDNVSEFMTIPKNKDCKACGQGEYEFLNNNVGSYTTSLCGSDSIQIVPQTRSEINFQVMHDKLLQLGEVSYNRFLLRFSYMDINITLFPDGRAIIKGVTDPNVAKSVYSEYIGF